MRIIHFADLHLGATAHGQVDETSGRNSRVLDCLARLDELVVYALDVRADIVVFAGDAFHSRRPDPTLQRDFAERLSRLRSNGIELVLVGGNHDQAATSDKATSIDIYSAMNIGSVYAFGAEPKVFTIRGLQIAALPYQGHHQLVSVSEKGATFASLQALYRRRLHERLCSLADRIDSDYPAILVAHIGVLGASTSSESKLFLGQDPQAFLSSVSHPAFDACLLGHLHRGQTLREHSPVVMYSGSLNRVSFSEEDQVKGFFVIDIMADRTIRREFVEVAARSLVTIRAASVDDLTEVLLDTIDKTEDIEGAIVRVIGKTKHAGSVDRAQILKALERRGAFSVAQTRVTSTDAHRARRLGMSLEDFANEPEKALRRFWEIKRVPEERQVVLLAHFRELEGG